MGQLARGSAVGLRFQDHDKREGVIRQLAATLTDPQIAVRLGCSPRTVLRIRAAAGIPAARPSGDNRVGAA